MTLRRFTLVIACLLLLGCGAWAAAALYFDGPLHPWNALLSCLYLIACAGVLRDDSQPPAACARATWCFRNPALD